VAHFRPDLDADDDDDSGDPQDPPGRPNGDRHRHRGPVRGGDADLAGLRATRAVGALLEGLAGRAGPVDDGVPNLDDVDFIADALTSGGLKGLLEAVAVVTGDLELEGGK